MREMAIDTESVEEDDEDIMKGLGAGCYSDSQQACKQYTQSQWERGAGGRIGV